MELRIENPQSRNLLILVHGLNGSLESWEGNSEHFIENLRSAPSIKPFDVYLFQYPTKIFELTQLKKLWYTIKGLVSNKPHEAREGFNIGISKIARNLEAEIRDVQVHYDTISFIAHSMGGLVVKSAIVWMPAEVQKKVRLFVSLSVPHMGAQLASIGTALFGNHPQLVDLKGMGEFTTDLNRRYAALKRPPRIYYQHGIQDTIVCEAASIPGMINTNDTATTPDDHFSVLRIQDATKNHLFRTILRELNEAIQPHQGLLSEEKSKTQLDELQHYATLAEEFDRIQIDNMEERVRKRNEIGGRMGEFIIQHGIRKADISTQYSETSLVGLLFAIIIGPQAGDHNLLLNVSNRIRLSYSKFKFIEALSALEGKSYVQAEDRTRFAAILKRFLPDPSTHLPRQVGRAMTALSELTCIRASTVPNGRLLINHDLRISQGTPRWDYPDDIYYEKVFYIDGGKDGAVDGSIDVNGQVINELEYTFVDFGKLVVYAQLKVKHGPIVHDFWLALKTNIVEASKVSDGEWQVPVQAAIDLGDWRRAVVNLPEAFHKTEKAGPFTYVNLEAIRFRGSGKIGAVFVT